MSDKFVTYNEDRPTATGLPQAVDTKINTRYATKVELDSAIIGTGGVVSPSVGRIIASSDPDTPLDDGDLLLLYAPPITHFEDWSDGLTGWENLWTDEPWTVEAAGESASATIVKSGSARVALGYDSEPLGDVEVVAKISISGISSSFFIGGVGIRATGSTSSSTALGVFAQYGKMHIIQLVPGSFAARASTDFSPTPGQPYWVRLRVYQGVASAKVWNDGTTEPSAWQMVWENPAALDQIAAGQVALLPGGYTTTVQYHQVGIAELDTGDEVAPVMAS